MHEEEQRRLNLLAGGPRTGPRKGCPSSGELASLAAGLLDTVRRDALLDHAAGCDSCGATLRALVEDFADETSPPESRVLESLESSKLEWQLGMASRMACGGRIRERPHGRREFYSPLWSWLARAAAVIVAVYGGWLGWNEWFAANPERLLAAAYTEQRPFLYRIPGARHAELARQERGGSSGFRRPQALDDAISAIKGKLKRNREDIKALELRARGEMLERSPEDAIADLKHALERKPDDPDLKADLGIAYALRAESLPDRAVDYGYAIEYFEQSLRAKPNAPETVFNLALVYEQMNMVEDAIREWRRYVELDTSGAWHDEAQRRLSDLEQTKKNRQAALERISDKSPDRLLRSIDRGEPVEPEDYLTVAVTDWLLRRGEGSRYDRVLSELAKRFVEQHHDPWLRDVMAAKRSDGSGLVSLAGAVEANLADQTEQALANSREAARQLNRAGNAAAALRADLERIYGLQRTMQSLDQCIAEAQDLERAASSGHYSWLTAKAVLEQGNCRSMNGDSGAAFNDMSRALALARSARYPDLELHAAGLLSEMQVATGNQLGIWKLGRGQLATYWSSGFPAIRAHEFYGVLEISAEGLGLHQSAFILQQAAATAIGGTQRLQYELLARTYLARLAVEAGRPADARIEFDRADRLLDRMPQTPSVNKIRTLAVVDRAYAELAAEHAQAALMLLDGIGPTAKSVGSVAESSFQEALGDALWRSGNSVKAEAAYRRAIELTESRLATVRGTRARAELLLAFDKGYRGLVQLLCDRNDPRSALRIWEWYRAGQAPAERGEPDLDVRLPQLRKESFLAFAVLPGGVVSWLFDDRGVTSTRLSVQPQELEIVSLRFLRECADPGSDRESLRRDGRQLYDWLVRPLAHRLDPVRTLVIEPDGSIGAIPMQALVDENSRYLGDRFPIAVAGGLTDYQLRAAAGPVHVASRVLILAAPNLGSEMSRAFPPLKGADEEGRFIAAKFRRRRPVLLTGAQATLQAVNQHSGGVELFHFAGHGFSNAGNGGLLLSPDPGSSLEAGILDGSAMARQNWTKCRLAVLTACSAGTGESGPGNPESLVHGFLWAGVARVVASRWNVDTSEGARLVEQFYNNLLAGNDTSQALQYAARTIRAKEETGHPYFWAGFENFGTR